MLGAPQNRALHRLSPNRPPTPLFDHQQVTPTPGQPQVTHTGEGKMLTKTKNSVTHR